MTKEDYFRDWKSVTAAYAVALGGVMLGAGSGHTWPLFLVLGLFTAWDLAWLKTCSGEPGRTAQEVLDSSTRARTYMSYFVAVYGVGLAFALFRLDDAQRESLGSLLEKADVAPLFLLAPLILCGVALLFFPIQLGKKGDDKPLTTRAPSSANVAVLAITAWVQKVATYLFIYVAILLLSRLVGV